jgi:hypothetical protein
MIEGSRPMGTTDLFDFYHFREMDAIGDLVFSKCLPKVLNDSRDKLP